MNLTYTAFGLIIVYAAYEISTAGNGAYNYIGSFIAAIVGGHLLKMGLLPKWRPYRRKKKSRRRNKR